MRGKASGFSALPASVGITPAYAGKRLLPSFLFMEDEDHPCVCGEKLAVFSFGVVSPGSPLRMRGKVTYICECKFPDGSPLRMRGKVLRYRKKTLEGGITPAYAGKR